MIDFSPSQEYIPQPPLLSLAYLAKEVQVPQQNGTYIWEGSHLEQAFYIASKYSHEGGAVQIDGPGPAWLVSGIAHAGHPSAIYLSDPKLPEGRVLVPKVTLDQSRKGDGPPDFL